MSADNLATGPESAQTMAEAKAKAKAKQKEDDSRARAKAKVQWEDASNAEETITRRSAHTCHHMEQLAQT